MNAIKKKVASRGTYRLRDIQPNNALECEELEQDPMLEQLRLHAAIKSQTADDRHGRHNELEDGDPQMRKVHAVGLSAILADSERDDGADPDDDRGGNELQDAVPDALLLCQSQTCP